MTRALPILSVSLLILGALSTPVLSEERPVATEERPVAKNAKSVVPLRTGDTLPDVSVQDATGRSVSLHLERPLVIVFFRGSWCPVCTRHFQELIKVQPQVAELGATIVAVSPDNVDRTKVNMEKLKVPFALLSDSDITAARAFGLAFQVDETTRAKYKGFGIDLEQASGNDHHALPVPAVYIVDPSGRIRFAHSNPDYGQRLDVQTILTELKKLRE